MATKSDFRVALTNNWRSLGKPKQLAVLGLVLACSFVLLATLFRWFFWDDVDINTFYYTLSTISQTLAGAFAFLVAVALFRMQSIESDMERALAEVIPYAVDSDHARLLHMKNRSHDWQDVDRYVRQETIDALPSDELKSAVSTNWNAVKMGRDTLSGLKMELVETLRLTSIVIGSSVVGIPLCQLLKTSRSQLIQGPYISTVILAMILLLSCLCLWSYWHIAKHLADRRPRHIYVSVGGPPATSSVVAPPASVTVTPSPLSSDVSDGHKKTPEA
jgi:hypothetical protein